MTITFVPLALPASWTDFLPPAATPITHLASQLFFPAALLVACASRSSSTGATRSKLVETAWSSERARATPAASSSTSQSRGYPSRRGATHA